MADVTYPCIPKCKYQYYLFVICGYDLILDKSVICLFCLIIDGNEQTFNFLFNKLKTLYKFNPHIVTCDYQLSLRLAFKKIFKEVKLYPCYYHFVLSIRKILLKYFIKKDNCLELFYDIFSNFRILNFNSKADNISTYIKIIYDKSRKDENFKKLIKYFKNQWLKKFHITDRSLYNISKKTIENNIIVKVFLLII